MKHDLLRKGSESLDVTSLWRDEGFHTCPGDGDCLREEFMQNGYSQWTSIGISVKRNNCWILQQDNSRKHCGFLYWQLILGLGVLDWRSYESDCIVFRYFFAFIQALNSFNLLGVASGCWLNQLNLWSSRFRGSNVCQILGHQIC